MADCKWHEGDDPVDPEEYWPGCPDCGRMYKLKMCDCCKRDFIDFEARGGDDVMAAIYVTSSGDASCSFCGPRIEMEEERMYDDESWGDYEGEEDDW